MEIYNIDNIYNIEFTNNELNQIININRFYNQLDNNYNDIIYNIINKNSFQNKKLSLRFLEWFVLIYSYNNIIYININTGNEVEKDFLINDFLSLNNPNIINIFLSYKYQTKDLTKQYFDPFKRQKIFYFKLNNNNRFLTTIAQLNFFKWIISNKIIDYIINNYDKIQLVFNQYNNIDRKNKQIKKMKKITKKNNQRLINIESENDFINNEDKLFTITI